LIRAISTHPLEPFYYEIAAMILLSDSTLDLLRTLKRRCFRAVR